MPPKRTITGDAPAKINLSLRIQGRRADGFHELRTLMAPIGLADHLELRLGSREGSEKILFHCSDPTLPTGSDNLAVAAAEAFFEALDALGRGRQESLTINLEKHIPSGAGLGGGSSDAAAVLSMLDELFDHPLGIERLAEIGGRLGSDVPFFLYQTVCEATGRGEIVAPVDFPHSLPLVLAKPDFGVPTPWAYQNWADSSELPGATYVRQLTPWGEVVNDLERPVFEKYLLLADLKSWFLGQPEVHAALLSGSGSTVYAVLRDPAGATPLLKHVREEFGKHLWLHATQTKPSLPSPA